jgi:hypothetical protein
MRLTTAVCSTTHCCGKANCGWIDVLLLLLSQERQAAERRLEQELAKERELRTQMVEWVMKTDLDLGFSFYGLGKHRVLGYANKGLVFRV